MSQHIVHLYDSINIDTLVWPETEEGQYAKKFLIPFIKNGSKHYIDNVDTQFMALTVGNTVIPVTVNETQYDNSFVCSPFSHYISYAFNILDKMKNKWLRGSVNGLLKVFSKIMKQGKLNKVVIVNNWLFTTSPHVVLDALQIDAITQCLKQRFPLHAILFRSVNSHTWKDSFKFLKKTGYNFIASRYVWITDSSQEMVFRTRVYKSDLKLLKECKYQILEQSEIRESDISKIQELYSALYIKKYSQINPQYNSNFFKLALDNELLRIKAIKQNEALEGVVGYSFRNGVMISSLFGYDPKDTENKGVYRLLSTLLMQEAQKNGGCYNQSAGGSFYKKIRRAEGHMEYTAVYCKHLPWPRKMPWQILRAALNTVGTRFMKQY
jgi:hypothetical protein